MAVAHGADQSNNAIASLSNAKAMALLWQAMASNTSQLLLGSWSKTYFDPKQYAPFYLLPTGVRMLEGMTQKLEEGNIEIDKMLDYFGDASEDN